MTSAPHYTDRRFPQSYMMSHDVRDWQYIWVSSVCMHPGLYSDVLNIRGWKFTSLSGPCSVQTADGKCRLHTTYYTYELPTIVASYCNYDCYFITCTKRNVITVLSSLNKKLSCRKETVRLLRRSVLAKCKWETIFCRHHRSTFNQSYRIR